ncbi:unnamed protein product, partial [Effrenium voratum]
LRFPILLLRIRPMADPKPLLETSVLLERQISGGAGHAGSPPGGKRGAVPCQLSGALSTLK